MALAAITVKGTARMRPMSPAPPEVPPYSPRGLNSIIRSAALGH